MDGQPFFAATQSANPGLIKTLEEQIVPRLLMEVPGQPSQQALDQDRYLARFTMIFDRAGYSPDFFKRMWQQRIEVITCHKHPQGRRSEEEFSRQTVRREAEFGAMSLLAESGLEQAAEHEQRKGTALGANPTEAEGVGPA